MEKNYPDGFRGTDLYEKLKAAGIEDGCAARDLSFNGKTVKADVVHAAFVSGLSSLAGLHRIPAATRRLGPGGDRSRMAVGSTKG